MPLLDSIHVFEDNIAGGAFETLAAADGDSLAIRYYGEGTKATLLEVWGGNNASKCDFSLRSPLLHDNTRGIRFAHMFNPTQSGADGNPQVYLGPYRTQPLVPTDTLVAEVNGTAADDVALTSLVYYEGGGTPAARLMGYQEVLNRMKNLVGIRVSPAPVAATSTYGTAEAINADDDRLKANKDYALLGLTTDLPFTTLALNGPDTANFRVAIPGHRDAHYTSDFFMDMSRRLNLPCVPIINANNRANTMVRLADVGGGTAPLVSLLFAELA